MSLDKCIKGVCFFGGYDAEYPRNEVLRKGLIKRGVPVVQCRTSPKRRFLTRYALLTYRYFKLKREFNVICVPEFRHKDVPLAYVLARLTRKKIIFDPLVSRYDTKIKDRRDAGERSFQAWHNRNIDRVALALCDLVLSDTQAHADYYARECHARAAKIRVLPVGFDEDLFSPGCGVPQAPPPARTLKVLFVGNYLPLHGVDVVAGAARVLRDFQDIEFVLIGRGQTFGDVERFVKREDLANVCLLARVPKETLASRIAQADICLGVFGRTDKTSRVVANKVYQSMAMGKAVITSDTAAIREFFADGENVCLVPAGDPVALADRILELYRDPEARAKIGAAAANLVHEKYTSREIAGRFLRFSEDLLLRNGQAPVSRRPMNLENGGS